ncbi:MAG TPA: helix-turn-helix domain-containing protein [Planctomycetota bacterium]|nr:helix-turn-helix domain-containing protein [Planctomycetota bacterium]
MTSIPSREKSGDRSIPALARGLRILRVLAAAGSAGASFGDLGRAMDGLPAPTLSRLLKALVASGHASRTAAGLYAAGPELEALLAERRSGGSLEDAARAAIGEFARRTGESVAFARFYGDRLVLTDKVEVPDSVTLAPPGQVFLPRPWEGPAVAVAAHLAGGDLERFARQTGAPVRTAASAPSQEPAPDPRFLELAAACRLLGWHAEPLPNRPAESAPFRICTAVLAPDGRPVGELHTASIPAREPQARERLAGGLLAARRAIEERLASASSERPKGE